MDLSQLLNQILSGAGISASQLPSEIDFSPGNILRALLILVGMYLAARLARRFTLHALQHPSFDPHLQKILPQVVFYSLIGLGVIWALGGFGLSVVVLGVAVAFALRDLIQNFAAGLLIMGTRPFKEGDWIVIGATEGQVAEVGWRGTFIDAFDGRRVIVPNSNVVTSVVTNNSIKSQLRSTLNLSVDRWSDFERVEQLILGALKDIEGIADEPPPSVNIDSLSGMAMNLSIRFWVKDPLNRQARAVTSALRAIQETLAQAEIELNPATAVVTSKHVGESR